MLGYGVSCHTMQEAGTLFARAFVIDNGTSKLGFVNVELTFITLSVQQGVIQKLRADFPQFGYTEANLMLTAQHTHSAPGGYSSYPLYNFPTPGFSNYVYATIVNAIVEAVVKAEAGKHAGRMRWGSGEFALDKEVAFQRSRMAYNLNADIPKKLAADELHLGVNREMVMLQFEAADGSPIGSVNWFGVHTTSLSNNLHRVHADNKGYAAQFVEDHFKSKGIENYVAAFAQGNCGDVSPRFRRQKNILNWQRGYWYGKFDDDYQSAEYNGRLQADQALEIAVAHNPVLSEDIDTEIWWVDFSSIHCQAEFANGNSAARTSPACLGVSFFAGALMDGPGMPPLLVPLAKWLSERTKQDDLRRHGNDAEVLLKYQTQAPKQIVFETNEGRLFGDKDLTKLLLPGWSDISVAAAKRYWTTVGSQKDKVCYTAKVLPLQLAVMGELALAAFPFEITVTSGDRLRSSLERRLTERGVQRVILVPYANDYAGYITTHEEYQAQMYEGGHTVFGQWSLAALQTKFDELAMEMMKPKSERTLSQATPPTVTFEEMNEFPFPATRP